MKKIVSAVLAMSVASAMSVPAFAVLTPDGEPVIQGDIMLLSEGTEAGEVVIGEGDAQTPIIVLPSQSEEDPKYTKSEITVTDTRVYSGLGGTGIIYDDDNIIMPGLIFDINGNSKSEEDIKIGDELILFDDVNKDDYAGRPIAEYVVIKDSEVEMGVSVDYFTVSETLGEYVDTQNFLAINISEDTEIVDVEGNELTSDDIADKYLMVFYDKMTMSIPAIANPSKVIVLGDYEPAEAEPTAEPEATEEPAAEPVFDYEFVVDGEDAITDENGVIIIPVRKYAESLGLEVVWNGEDMSVTVGTIPMGVSFRIGENSYSKAKMTPFVLEVAPQLINDTTYVPVSFFEQVLNAGVKIAKA